ncbi:MAG: 2-phospho-L-lactate transferase [Steroidobacteraceae bacterium]
MAMLALSGGVGGAKLVAGLAAVLAPHELTVLVNTADDFEHVGLCICPDIDSVLYGLAGLADPVRGWGRRDEQWNFLATLGELGGPTWFALGDRDLALHVYRTALLKAGQDLTACTATIARAFGLSVDVLPMCNEPVRTRLATARGWLEFQDYFVRQRCEPRVTAIEYFGAGTARAQPSVVEGLCQNRYDAIVICPSNPLLSIEPILAVPGMRDALRMTSAPVVAVSPLVGGRALKGPAAKILTELGLEPGPSAIADRYADLLDVLVIDTEDEGAACPGSVQVVTAPTIMHDDAERRALARAVIAAANGRPG